MPRSLLTIDPHHYGEDRGRTRVSRNHQVTIPKGPFRGASLSNGDRLKVDALGPGRIALTRIDEAGDNQASFLAD